MGLLEDMDKGENIDPSEILSRMLQPDNIEFKTEINDPMALTMLKTLATILNQYKLKKSNELLEIIIMYYQLYMTSHKRKRSEEIIRGVSALLLMKKPELSIGEKLIGEKGK